MIKAIIDIGSNTIRLAVYKISYNKIELLIKKKHAVGLAAYIKDGVMEQAGTLKACAVLNDFKAIISLMNIDDIAAFTTAAIRSVQNSSEVIRAIYEQTGFMVEIMSGDDEARFAFLGAVRSVRMPDGLMIDIGGASTELVVYRDYQFVNAASLTVGSLALYSECVHGILPGNDEIDAMRGIIKRKLAEQAGFNAEKHSVICGIGGTVKGSTKLYQHLYDSTECKIPCSALSEMIGRFTVSSGSIPNDVLDLLLNVVPERIKTIVPGMVIADTLSKYFGSDYILFSDSGVREGYLYETAGGEIGR